MAGETPERDEGAGTTGRGFEAFLHDKGTLTPFVGLYMVGFGAMALIGGNTEFIFYGVVMVVLIALVLWADRRVRFSMPVLWGLAVWGLLHMAGGNVPVGTDPGGERIVLYSYRPLEWFLRYDQAVHAFGFFVATLAAWEALRAGVRPLGSLRPTPGLAVGAALMGMGLGAVNEVVEFVAVLTLPKTNVGDYMNTGWDLVCNMVGAVVGAIVVWVRGEGK